MIRKTVVGAMLLMLAGCWGPDGCSFEDFRREFDPGYGERKPETQPLPQGQPHGPQDGLTPIDGPLPGGPPHREPDPPGKPMEIGPGGVDGGGGVAAAPRPKHTGPGASHREPATTRLAYAAPREEPARREDSSAEGVLDDYMADDTPGPGRHADPYGAPVYGAPVWRDRDPRPAAYPDPYRRPRYERREPRDTLATPRDRWDRRDRHDRRDRWDRGERMASHDRQALTPRDQRRGDRRAGRDDRHASADAGERRHRDRYDRERPDRRHVNRHDERRDRRADQQRCDAKLDHHASREDRRAARRACKGG